MFLTAAGLRRAALFALCALPLAAQALNTRVLVVYNSNSADSLNVANHYMAARSIPAANKCAIAPPANDRINLTDYPSTVQTPIQTCLNSVGSSNILYIVMSYQTPYVVLRADGNAYALDQYVADIWNKYSTQNFLVAPTATHGYYYETQAQGNVYPPFVSFASYRANNKKAYLFYSVWRLDGPSPAIATALVDNAIAAETSGLSGQACIDQYGPEGTYDSSYAKGNWDLLRASQFLNSAGWPVTLDTLGTEFGTAPSALTCSDGSGKTALYSGWYSFNNYNGASVFGWVPGSIGFHLDSASAIDPRGGPNWVANALLNGITVTSGSVTEPYLEGLVRPGGTFRNLLEGANVGDAFLRNMRWLKWMILNIGDPLYTPFPGGRAPFNPPPPQNSMGLNPRELVGGEPSANLSTATITLSAPAPGGGTTFSLSSDHPSIASVPASVTVPTASSSVTFHVTSSAVTVSTSVLITAVAGPLTLQNTVVLDPLLGGLSINPSTTSAGLSLTGTIVLSDRAPIGGAAVALSSNDPSASVPSPVTVPAGLTSAPFTITTTPVNVPTSPVITASYAGTTVTVSISVVPALTQVDFSNPSVAAGQGTTFEVHLGSPAPAGGATVNISNGNPSVLTIPSTITVPAGSTYGNAGVTTSPAASSGDSAQVTVTYGGSTKFATITIQ